MRIRTTRQAKRLRPLAIERARQSKIRAGDVMFQGGIGWTNVRVVEVYRNRNRGKLHTVMVHGQHALWMLNASVLYRTKAEYIASGVHWGEAPWQKPGKWK